MVPILKLALIIINSDEDDCSEYLLLVKLIVEYPPGPFKAEHFTRHQTRFFTPERCDEHPSASYIEVSPLPGGGGVRIAWRLMCSYNVSQISSIVNETIEIEMMTFSGKFS